MSFTTIIIVELIERRHKNATTNSQLIKYVANFSFLTQIL